MLSLRPLIPLVLLLVLAAAGLAPSQASAANAAIVVDAPSDEPAAGDPADGCDTAAGGCTLRAAIQVANARGGADVIEFDLPGIEPRVEVLTPLPPIVSGQPVTIDGWSQPGWEEDPGEPIVEIDGSLVEGEEVDTEIGVRSARPWGIDVRASQSVVRGLIVHSFHNVQMGVERAEGVTVQGNWIGLGRSGNVDRSDSRVGLALIATSTAIVGGSGHERNAISGSVQAQVLIQAARGGGTTSSVSNNLVGNWIGTSGDGLASVSGGEHGILVSRDSDGGAADKSYADTLTGNVVTGQDVGIAVLDGRETWVRGNWVGMSPALRTSDPLGQPFGNELGIAVAAASRDVLVGGPRSESSWEGNTVVNNEYGGIRVTGPTQGVEIRSNHVGVSLAGDRVNDPLGRPLGNGMGISIAGNSIGTPSDVTVGSATEPEEANVVGGNQYGVVVNDGASDVRLQRNFIGSSASGEEALPNANGVTVWSNDGATPPARVAVGTPGAGNVITDTQGAGVNVVSGSDVTVRSNRIGVTRAGADAGNGAGVVVRASGTIVGGGGAQEGNVISGNTGDGVQVVGSPVGAQVLGNVIGLAADGGLTGDQATAHRNGGSGIVVFGSDGGPGPRDTEIGGGLQGTLGNDISNNERGISVIGSAETTWVTGNSVGAYSADIVTGNSEDGIVVRASGTTIGGTQTLDRNVVTGNAGSGVRVAEDAQDTTIVGNSLGTDAGVPEIVGNGRFGVEVADGAERTRIGELRDATLSDVGDCPRGQTCNVIADNDLGGVRVAPDAGPGTTVRGNVMRRNGGLDVDLVHDGPTGNAMLDPVRSREGVVNAPAAVRFKRRSADEVRLSGELPIAITGDDPSTAVVDLYGSDAIAARGKGGRFLASVRPDDQGRWAVTLDDPERDSYSAYATWADGSTSEPSVACTGAPGDADPDPDGDTLCRSWEVDGLDYDGDEAADLYLPGKGASIDERDLFLEIDQMDGLNVPDGTTELLERALLAGPDGGIRPHFDYGEEPWLSETVPATSAPLEVTERGPGALDDVVDYRYGRHDRPAPCEGYLGTPQERRASDCAGLMGARNAVYRHVLLAHTLATGDSGYADPAGRGLVVAAGGKFRHPDTVLLNGGRGVCGIVPECYAQMTAGTLMHELGHTLGGLHGGDEATVNNKPNYLSVMNYSFQWRNLVPQRPLDYSRETLPTIDEQNIDENVPLIGPNPPPELVARWPQTVFAQYDEPRDKCMSVVVDSGAAPWDYDDDDSTASRFAVDVNSIDTESSLGDEACEDEDNRTTLRGFDDWANMRLAFPLRAGWADGNLTELPPGSRRAAAAADDEQRMTVELAEELAAGTDADDDGISNLDDNCSAVANADQADEDGDGIGDACLADMPQRDLEVTLAGSRNVPIGEERSVELRVHNAFPVAATGARVQISGPGGPIAAAIGEPTQGELDGDVWELGSIGPRETATLPIELSATELGEGELRGELIAADQPDWDSTPGNGDPAEDDEARQPLRAVPEGDAGPVLSVRDLRIRERDGGQRDAIFRLAIDRGFDGEVSVDYATADGTAQDQADYAARTGTARLGDGQTEATVRVPVKGDVLDEGPETFALDLSGADGATLDRERATATIVDDDRPQRPGDARYLTCLSGDRGPVGSCPATDPRIEDPRAVAASPDGRFLYVADRRRVTVLSRDDEGASLAVESCIAIGAAAAGCETLPGSAGDASEVALSPDGRQLYVVAQREGTFEPEILTFARDAQTGALRAAAGASAVPAREGGTLAIPADGTHVYVMGGRGGGFGRVRILTYARDAATGALTAAGCFEEGEGSESDECAGIDVNLSDGLRPAFSPDGRSLYVRGQDSFALLARDPESGELSTGPCVRLEDGSCAPLVACPASGGTEQCPPPPIDETAGRGGVAVSPDGDSVTTTTATFGILTRFEREADGDLVPTGCIQEAGLDPLLDRPCEDTDAPLSTARSLTASADGRDLYAATTGGGLIAFASTDGETGVEDGRCADPDLGFSACGGEDEQSGPVDPRGSLLVPAGGRTVHALVPLRGVGGARRDGVATFLRIQPSGDGEPPAPPVCADGVARTQPGRAVTLQLRCADPAGAALALEIAGGPDHGTLGAIGGDSVEYTPSAGFSGTDVVRFRARSGDRVSGEARVTITVADLAPVCDDIEDGAAPGGSTRIALRCADPEGGPVSISIATRPDRGTLGTVNAAGEVTYTAPAGGGATSFTYVGTDGAGNVSAPARVGLAVPTPPPPPPPAPPSPGGGNSGGGSSGGGIGRKPPTGCGRSCTAGPGGTVEWIYFCDGRRTDNVNECSGTFIICPTRGLCSNPSGRGTSMGIAAASAKPRRGPLAHKQFRVAAGESVKLRVRLNARGRALLAKRRRLTVRVVLAVRQPDGRTERTVKRVTIKAPKRQRRRGRDRRGAAVASPVTPAAPQSPASTVAADVPGAAQRR